MSSLLRSFMTIGRSYILNADGWNGNLDGGNGSQNFGLGSSSRVSEIEMSGASSNHAHHNDNQTVSDNNGDGPWMNQVLNYLNVAGNGNEGSSQGSSSGQSVRPQSPKPVEEVVKEHSEVLKALVLLKFEQHEMNISFRNEFATHKTQITGLDRKISGFEKELSELKRKFVQRSTEDEHQGQQRQPEGGHTSRRLVERNFTSRVGTGQNVNHLTPPASEGGAETVCPHCHGSYINLYAHIRFYCHQSPEQLQGDRVPCPFCEKYYSKRYLKVHSRRFCRVAGLM